MKSVFIVLAVTPFVAACSMGSQNLSLGYADSGASKPERSASQFSGGFEPRTSAPTPRAAKPQTRVAALDTNKPKRDFAKAPKGSLSDRDYSGTNLNRQQALEMVNAYRSSKGLKTLKLHPKLTRAAKMHSRDLAKWDRISHYGSDGSNPWDRVKRAGFKARLAAENVGTGQKDLSEVFRGWKQSPGHNKNLLLADATHMGIALVDDPKTEFKTFWTLVLGAPL
ncbi:MAG: CAP domain-containing protein [Pseudomonadota bacterium]